MEELRSTDALDREILEDARKKADRILRTAEQALKTLNDEWNNRTVKAIAELERLHMEAGDRYRREVMARLPLDKRRARSERTEGLLRSAMDEYVSRLPRERLLSLLERDLKARAPSLPAEGLQVSCRGMDQEEAESLLGACLPAASRYSFRDVLTGGSPELTIDSKDVRVVVSISARVDELLAEKRGELTKALLGEGACND